MKKILWILVAVGACLVAAALSADQAGEKAGNEAATKAAREAAKSWLGVVDSGWYAESWSQASSSFRSQITADRWKDAVRAARTPLGKLLLREFKSAEYTRTLPGVRDGEYVVILYDGSFRNKKEALETVVTMKEKDGSWKVAGYFIK